MTLIAPLTGLLLGAGASQEYGMPLAAQVSQRLRSELPAPGLRFHNKRAQAVGRGVPDTILEEFLSVLVRPDMGYENIIGYLETSYLRNATKGKPGQGYHRLASILADVIYKIIYQQHMRLKANTSAAISYMDGIPLQARQVHEMFWT